MGPDFERHLETSLTEALTKGYIQAYYQPVIRSLSGKLCSFEALARWIDPEHGPIYPNAFIPALEQARLIHLLDIHILRQACARIRQSIDEGAVPIPVSINLSRLDFELCDIYYEVTRTVAEFQIPRDFLYIEITESLMAEQGSSMGDVVNRFRSAGFQVWMDDFGSGYSSLNVLKDFYFDEIKLDMNFLTSFDQRSRRIMASVIQMAKELGIHTLAEGVETEEQVDFLRDIGCEKMQGYFFGKPLPFEEQMAHLASLDIDVEPPAERSYYDGIGKVDFLSAVPFMTQDEKDSLVTARQLNSIPLCVTEVRQDGFRVLFYNSAFEDTATSTGKISGIFSREMLRKLQPFSLLPERVIKLVDSTRSGTEARMYFISNEEYYEIQAKCVAQTRDTYCVLFRMSNLSRAFESERTERLDEGLRQVYSLYEHVTLIDTQADRLLPLYVGTHEEHISGRSGLVQLCRNYCQLFIHPEDHKTYLEFSDPTTLEQRLTATDGSTTEILRTRVAHGNYEWKAYTVVRLQPHTFLELIRNVHQEIVTLAKHNSFTAESFSKAANDLDVPDEYVWRTLVNSDLVNLFWKNSDRRFLGATRGFLDYYGFESVDDIRGKNDEDLGWHVQPGLYKNDELDVIHEGVETRNVLGHCMRNGENRDIFASKTPLYGPDGSIRGLVGYFIDAGTLHINDSRGDETKRRDLLTGLLNSRGIHEEAILFRDEYYLRGTDFTRIHVCIDDIAEINSQYGYDFGDKAITELGKGLKRAFGQAAAVGRYSGHQLALLCQVQDEHDEGEQLAKAKQAAERIHQIEGIAITLYVSVGSCRFSEVETLEEQAKKAEIRQLADQDEHLSASSRQTRAGEIFHLYDNLPIAYVVYHVELDEQNKAKDAILFYVNYIYEERYGKKASELLGKGTRELFPYLTDEWYEQARRAAYEGEIIADRFVFEPSGEVYFMTASQVIRPGYCCFTYQQFT